MPNTSKPSLSRKLPSPFIINGLMVAAVCVLFIAALQTGAAHINLLQAIKDISQGRESLDSLIFSDIRLPRAILATVVGATLGIAGAALQGLLRNPLAGPGLVGVSNGAALGAVIALYFGLSSYVWFAIPAAGMLGAGLAVLLVFLLSGRTASIMTLLLAGVAVNALASSFISLALNFAPNPYAMSEMVFWLLGSIANRSMSDVYLSFPFMLLGWLMILSSAKFLTALSLGEETAKTLGFNATRSKIILIIGVAFSVGAAVSISGSIGFVGLVVPHIMRPLMRYEPGKLLFSSALAGALMILSADILVQVISPTQELKLGVVTALVGGPFFLYLIVNNRYAFK